MIYISKSEKNFLSTQTNLIRGYVMAVITAVILALGLISNHLELKYKTVNQEFFIVGVVFALFTVAFFAPLIAKIIILKKIEKREGIKLTNVSYREAISLLDDFSSFYSKKSLIKSFENIFKQLLTDVGALRYTIISDKREKESILLLVS